MRQIVILILIIIFITIGAANAQTGAIRGYVYDASNNPISGVSVRAYLSSGTYFEQRAISEEDGSYLIVDLPVGLYSIRVFNTKGFVNQFYNNALNESDATLVKVNADETIENINFYLERGRYITGSIYSANGQPITTGVAVNFYDAHSKTQRGNASSDEEGCYISPALPAGEHIIMAGNPGQGYVFTYYENASSWGDATVLNITNKDTLSGIDFYLKRGGAISGIVSAEDNPDTHIRAWVVVKDQNTGQWCSEAWSDSVTGYYCAGGLRPGNYTIFTYSTDPTKYHTQYFWKSTRPENAKTVTVVSSDTTRDVDFFLIPVTYSNIQNDYVMMTVCDKYPGTNFTMGTKKGLPNTDFDNNKDLLFGHPYPHTSYTTVKINNNAYIFGSAEGDYLYEGNIIDPDYRRVPKVNIDGTSITWGWTCRQVKVVQTISIVQSEWSNNKMFDTAKIKYVITNMSDYPQQVGLRILLDTMLGENDGAPIRTPDGIYTDHERLFLKSNVPAFWTAIEGDSTRTKFSAQGTLKGYAATPPDRFATVKWKRIFNELWDYQPNDTCKIIHDSGVALWWEPILLNTYETREFVTYYGLGEMIPDTIAPYIDDLDPDSNITTEPNSNIILHVKDDYMGVDGKTIKMWVDKVRVYPDTSSDRTKKDYRLFYDSPQDFEYNDNVLVEVEAYDRAYKPNSMYESYHFFTVPLRDTLSPWTEGHQPAKGEKEVIAKPKISLLIKDDLSGVDSSSVEMTINNNRIYPEMKAIGLGYQLTYQPDTSFHYNQTIHISINANDLAEDSNPMDTDDYKFYIKEDKISPYLLKPNPAPGDLNVKRNTSVSFFIKDSVSGVDSSSIQLFVNHKSVSSQIRGDAQNGYFVIYQPKTLFNFAEQETIRVTAQDFSHPPNVMDTTYSFTTVAFKDTLPPYTTGHRPKPDEHNISPDVTIFVEVKDDYSGVNEDSVIMRVNYEEVNPEILEVTDGYRLSYDPTNNFLFNDSVFVEIDAQDLADDPNNMKTDSYAFYIQQDKQPPYTTQHIPQKYATNVDFDTPIRFFVKDDIAGVDISSVTLTVAGNIVDFNYKGSPNDYEISYQPRYSFSSGQKVNIIIYAVDMSNPQNEMEEQYDFTIKNVLPDLMTTLSVDSPQVVVHHTVTLTAGVINKDAPVRTPFSVVMRSGKQLIDSTIIDRMDIDEVQTLTVPFTLHKRGKYKISIHADSKNEINESNKKNNFEMISVEAVEGKLTVRSNPFTPNGDGINDDVGFDFKQFSLTGPTLKIYDFQGRSIITLDQHTSSKFIWNGKDSHGRAAQPGIYLYILQDGNRNVARGYVVLAR